jgi:hypothetical protein
MEQRIEQSSRRQTLQPQAFANPPSWKHQASVFNEFEIMMKLKTKMRDFVMAQSSTRNT